MLPTELCCMLDPLRGCKTCGWQICSYHYMVSGYIGSQRSVESVHKFAVEGHYADIISFRDMTYQETLVGKREE